jgi:hypothetical protein
MGFYLRKSFRLGPLRLNLSKSGLGASVGVKGARVGVDAKGKGYVAGGRGGLYFRERIPTSGETGRGVVTLVLWLIIVALLGLAVALILGSQR